MNIARFTLLTLLILNSASLFAQKKYNCEANFKWVKETFEKNDAGFEYALEQKGKKAYAQHNTNILKKIKMAADNDQCVDIIHEWLEFFRKSHFYIAAIPNGNVKKAEGKNPWPTLAISEADIRGNSAGKKVPGFEGLWETGNYTIGIIKSDQGYKGVILNTKGGNEWKVNQVKLEISKDSSGVFYMGNYSSAKFDKAVFTGSNALKLGYIYLHRIYPVFSDKAAISLYAKEMEAATPFIQGLSNETVLFRIPSFNSDQKSLIDSLVLVNQDLLKTKKNLIIDIRNNGGGSDESYDHIIPFLYTNPIRITNLELFSTPLNNKRMEGFLSTPNLSERSKQQINRALNILNNNIGKFVNLDTTIVSVQKLDSILPNPQSVAIIINENNGSTAEQFILAAKQSKKVKLFGTTTMGVLDISNMNYVDSPDKQINLGYCLSKSLRIPDMKIDNIGIAPDYYIDKSITSEKWLDFVKGILEN